MSIVSNASPLINLVRIGQLNLLHQLYNEIVVPEAVWREVVIEGSGQPGADELKSATWVKTQGRPSGTSRKRRLRPVECSE